MHYSFVTTPNQPRGIAGDLTLSSRSLLKAPHCGPFSLQFRMFSSHCHICLYNTHPWYFIGTTGKMGKKTTQNNKKTTTQTLFNQPPHMKTLNFFSPGFDVKFGYQTRNGEIQNKFKLTLRAGVYVYGDG